MYCNSVAQSYNSKDEIIKLGDPPPKPNSVVLLDFNPKRILDDANTPFFLQVPSLAQDFVFKVGGKPIVRHEYC